MMRDSAARLACRLVLASCLGILALLSISCAHKASKTPTGPLPGQWRGVSSIDSYAGPGEVKLYWFTATNLECIDPVCPPPGPVIAKVQLLQSTVGPQDGYRPVYSTFRSGRDSTTVAGLATGRSYWFRVAAFDAWGGQLLISDPVMTVPGSFLSPSMSVSITAMECFSWSPGGDSSAYVDASIWNQWNVAILDLRTGAAYPETSYPAGDERVFGVAWSPDGRVIAYTHTPTLTSSLVDYRVWGLTLSDGTSTSWTSGPVDFDAAWGGTRWLYFCRGTQGPPNIPEIWRVDPASPGSEQAITSDQSVYKYHPSVRQSDDLIVYDGLYLLSPATGVSRPLTVSDWWQDTVPAWAPDGRHVAFISTRSGHREAWSVDVASGATTQLTRGQYGAEKACASWSPDGRRLGVIVKHRWQGYDPGRLEIYEASAPLP
jgi:dipeptidyl aminopeptidase/acylaminoacyl peptidase